MIQKSILESKWGMNPKNIDGGQWLVEPSRKTVFRPARTAVKQAIKYLTKGGFTGKYKPRSKDFNWVSYKTKLHSIGMVSVEYATARLQGFTRAEEEVIRKAVLEECDENNDI